MVDEATSQRDERMHPLLSIHRAGDRGIPALADAGAQASG